MANKSEYQTLSLVDALRWLAEIHYDPKTRHLSRDEYQLLQRAADVISPYAPPIASLLSGPPRQVMSQIKTVSGSDRPAQSSAGSIHPSTVSPYRAAASANDRTNSRTGSKTSPNQLNIPPESLMAATSVL